MPVSRPPFFDRGSLVSAKLGILSAAEIKGLTDDQDRKEVLFEDEQTVLISTHHRAA